MSINVTLAGTGLRQELLPYKRAARLTITGLTAGADNVVPHGLPFTPTGLSLRPSALGLWAETQVPDATNIYITVGGGGAVSGTVDVAE